MIQDKVLLEILRNRFQAIGDEMASVAFRTAQPGSADPAQEFPRIDRHRTGVDQQLIALTRYVVVVVVEPAFRDPVRGGEGMQFCV